MEGIKFNKYLIKIYTNTSFNVPSLVPC